ncbi:oxidoreductase family protein [Epithele typhae]|uniref:oxidoreductase family protein n=1 Tax=Epithele typhae TaxID=378194 RepID=UPI0020081EC0|nr:oxidoreductase family protein [Epithele typhae]KAH9924981.1 oxidoreductase family protein [Epithele typhae]
MTASPTRLALLGAGIFAKESHLPALAQLGSTEVTLVAVYSRSEASASSLAADAQTALGLDAPPAVYHDDPKAPSASASLDALLARADIDGVVVVLPITVQPAIILKALAAGKHVLSEKPVAPDVERGRALIREYEGKYVPKGLVWRVAENEEAEPPHVAARRFIQEGKIGKVTFFSARVVGYVDEKSKYWNTPWRTVPDYQGGFLLDGGVHTIATLRVVLGDAPMARLAAHASLTHDILPPHDTIHALVATASGAHGLVELSWGAPVPSRAARAAGGIAVTDTDGWLEVGRAAGGDAVRCVARCAVRDARGRVAGETEEVVEAERAGVRREIASWLAAVRGEDDGINGPRGALADVAFIEAALNSGGKEVDLLELAKV